MRVFPKACARTPSSPSPVASVQLTHDCSPRDLCVSVNLCQSCQRICTKARSSKCSARRMHSGRRSKTTRRKRCVTQPALQPPATSKLQPPSASRHGQPSASSLRFEPWRGCPRTRRALQKRLHSSTALLRTAASLPSWSCTAGKWASKPQIVKWLPFFKIAILDVFCTQHLLEQNTSRIQNKRD